MIIYHTTNLLFHYRKHFIQIIRTKFDDPGAQMKSAKLSKEAEQFKTKTIQNIFAIH